MRKETAVIFIGSSYPNYQYWSRIQYIINYHRVSTALRVPDECDPTSANQIAQPGVRHFAVFFLRPGRADR
jgi:hypothetical protein